MGWRSRCCHRGHASLPSCGSGEDQDTADASIQGTAGELVLVLYGRIPVDSLKVEGDRCVFDLLLAWDPDA
ncbi:hypothetical protein [Streptomyces sp. NPDC006446]|uniref:hypothetical protein n=1 Tax=Streptomyces sp. NPDC006446 TaxID=3154301 RepID=UPI0033B3B26B